MKNFKNLFLMTTGLLLTLGTASTVFTSCVDPDNPVTSQLVLPAMITVTGGSTTLNGIEVPISSFQIGKYEVTQKQWQQIMGSNPSTFRGDNLPVETVSHDDIQTFLAKLNAQTGNNYRLPTDAEWEYAAKGGQSTHSYDYSGSNTIGDVAWYRDNSGAKTHPVGTKTANELGIHDMSGNVWEWCSDWYDETGSARVIRGGSWDSEAARCHVSIRGGSWDSEAARCHVSNRGYGSPNGRDDGLGFRLVLPL